MGAGMKLSPEDPQAVRGAAGKANVAQGGRCAKDCIKALLADTPCSGSGSGDTR
jgi:hypothetical protein